MAFVMPVVEHWLECEVPQWVHPMKDQSDDPSHHERTLLPRSYISLLSWRESLAMPEAVPMSGRVRNVTVCGHINTFQQQVASGNLPISSDDGVLGPSNLRVCGSNPFSVG